MSETIPGEVRKLADEVASAVCAQVAGSSEIIARALLARDERAAKEEREACAAHLSEIAQAMWDRCETKRSPDPFAVGKGEMEDAVTAWCFDKAASAIRDRSKT